MKRKIFALLCCGFLALGLAAAAQEEGAPVETEVPAPAADPDRMQLVVSPYDKKEKTLTVEAQVPGDTPFALRYGSIGGQAWVLVIGGPISDGERKLNLVGGTPLLAIHKDDAEKLMSGQPLEEKMTLYAKRSRLPKGSAEEDYRYVWLIGTRVARALETEETLPWSDSESVVPLLVDIQNFDHRHDQQDKGKVTLGKGSVVVEESRLEVAEDNPFVIEEGGQYLFLLTDEGGNREFAVVNAGTYTKPVSTGRRDRDGDEEDAEESEPVLEWAEDFEYPELPNDGWGW